MKRIALLCALLFLAIIATAYVLRTEHDAALLVRAAEEMSVSAHTVESAPAEEHALPAPEDDARPEASAPTWPDFERKWAAVLERERRGAYPVGSSAAAQVEAEVSELRSALRLAQLTEIAASARSRTFVSDTETLLAATRPGAAATSEQLAAVAALQQELSWLADRNRPDLGVTGDVQRALVGDGPPAWPSSAHPTDFDLERFSEQIKRVLIYTSVPIDDVLGAADTLAAVLRERLERARQYDAHLARALELALQVLGGAPDSRAGLALQARLNAPLDEVVALVAIDFAEQQRRGREQYGESSPAWALHETEMLWLYLEQLHGGWLLRRGREDLAAAYGAEVARERQAPNNPPLPEALQRVYDGVQRDREAAGLEPKKRNRAADKLLRQQVDEIQSMGNPFAPKQPNHR